MILLKIILWAITALGCAIFLYFWFIPYIRNKWFFWRWSKYVRRTAKKMPSEEQAQLNELADILSQAGKEEKLFDDDEDKEN